MQLSEHEHAGPIHNYQTLIPAGRSGKAIRSPASAASCYKASVIQSLVYASPFEARPLAIFFGDIIKADLAETGCQVSEVEEIKCKFQEEENLKRHREGRGNATFYRCGGMQPHAEE